MFHNHAALINLVLHEKIEDVDVLGAAQSQCVPIFLKNNSNLIILIESCFVYLEPLVPEKIICPQ